MVVVGDRWFGRVDPVLGERAVRLARAVAVELLGVHFTRADAAGLLITAELMPELSDPAVVDAVADLLLTGRRVRTPEVAA